MVNGRMSRGRCRGGTSARTGRRAARMVNDDKEEPNVRPISGDALNGTLLLLQAFRILSHHQARMKSYRAATKVNGIESFKELGPPPELPHH